MVLNRPENMRSMKAMTIVGLNQVKRISQWTYKVKSQSSESWYDVKYVYTPVREWTCTCSDFLFRHLKVGISELYVRTSKIPPKYVSLVEDNIVTRKDDKR